MQVRSINTEVSGEWRIRFADIGTPGVDKADYRHPSQKLPCCYVLHLIRGDMEHPGLQISPDDIIVYALGEKKEWGEVLATTRRPLPAGSTVVALFVKESGELYDLALSLHRGAPLIQERLNLANRIEMALGSLGVFIPREICP
ncbi:MAG TPA: hypothetical protein VLF88_02970 [Candidatus Babeliales bacterium]|nr:hypothetical protein [Candidatus Babeliales bacterium]